MKLLLVVFSSVLAHAAAAQKIYTKDSILISDLNEFRKGCIEASKEKMVEFRGMKIEAEKYCDCAAKALLPQLYSWELEEVAKTKDFNSLLLRNDNYKHLMGCLESHISHDSSVVLKLNKDSTLQVKIAVMECVAAMKKDSASGGRFTDYQINAYCTCATQRMFKSNLTIAELHDAGNPESGAFQLAIVPCLDLLTAEGGDSIASVTQAPARSRVSGDAESSSVSIIVTTTQTRLPITIGNRKRFFLLDTGASITFINKELETFLLEDGYLTEEDYGSEEVFKLANGETLTARTAVVSSIALGDYKVEHVKIAITEKGLLLCGKNILDAFSKWELRKAEKQLVLYK